MALRHGNRERLHQFLATMADRVLYKGSQETSRCSSRMWPQMCFPTGGSCYSELTCHMKICTQRSHQSTCRSMQDHGRSPVKRLLIGTSGSADQMSYVQNECTQSAPKIILRYCRIHLQNYMLIGGQLRPVALQKQKNTGRFKVEYSLRQWNA